MITYVRSLGILFAAALLLLVASGCTKQARKAGHLRKAGDYYSLAQYDKAEIEYLNALQIEPLNSVAIAQLALIYFDQGRLGRFGPYLMKARELQPENLELRLRLSRLYLSSGNVKQAATEALYVLDHRPNDPEAPLLLAEASSQPDETAAALQRLSALPPAIADTAPVLVAKGTLDLRRHATQDAEAALHRALDLDPKSSAGHAALGVLHLSRNERAQGDVELKLAASFAPARTQQQLLYARYKIQTGDPSSARRSLEEVTRTTPDNLNAWTMLAELALTERNFPESALCIAKVFALDPAHPEALLLNARLKLATGDKEKALVEIAKMLKLYPRSAQAHYQQGLIYFADGDLAKAAASLTQALTLAPSHLDAQLLLAEINLRKGDFQPAITSLTALVKQQPTTPRARFLLADAYRAQGNFSQALAIYDQLEELLPRDPQPAYWKGTVLLQLNNRDEAKLAFNQSLKVAPDFLLALDQLVSLNLAEKNYTDALQLVEKTIAQNAKQPGAYLIQARIYLAKQNLDSAETSIRKAIELQPDAPAPYLMLARLYAGSNRLEKALTNFQSVLEKSPKNLEALMMAGTIQTQQGNFSAAKESYEKLLAINPGFSAALNNLAYIYAEQLNQLDRAKELAERARELLPNEPHVADTLGWILYKKGQYPWALSLLTESASKLINNAEVQFHLGMTHYMMGNEARAEAVLQLALDLQKDFPGADLAQHNLSILRLKPESADNSMISDLERELSRRPDDPVALSRLAAIQVRSRAVDQAIETYQKALKSSPTNVTAMLSLARLLSTHQQSAKALELAKAARKLSPDDPKIAQFLGCLAFAARDYDWSYSLLQEAVRKQPEDAELQFNFAQAAYSLGHESEAETAMQNVVAAGALHPRATDARLFLSMTALAAVPPNALAATAQIAEALKAHADFVPALMAQAASCEQLRKTAEARATYESVLSFYPEFAPAQRRLTLLYAEDSSKNPKAIDLALKARGAYPNDAELTKAFGIIVYRQGDFTRAANLLQDSARQRGNDAELMYFLGACQYELKQPDQCRRSLQRALELTLRPELDAEARRLLKALP